MLKVHEISVKDAPRINIEWEERVFGFKAFALIVKSALSEENNKLRDTKDSAKWLRQIM
jgi:hypothetical protein